jgi:hypothetical protein
MAPGVAGAPDMGPSITGAGLGSGTVGALPAAASGSGDWQAIARLLGTQVCAQQTHPGWTQGHGRPSSGTGWTHAAARSPQPAIVTTIRTSMLELTETTLCRRSTQPRDRRRFRLNLGYA